jgi:hypothetical protein
VVQKRTEERGQGHGPAGPAGLWLFEGKPGPAHLQAPAHPSHGALGVDVGPPKAQDLSPAHSRGDGDGDGKVQPSPGGPSRMWSASAWSTTASSRGRALGGKTAAAGFHSMRRHDKAWENAWRSTRCRFPAVLAETVPRGPS